LGVHNAFGLGVVTDNFTTVSVTNLSAARDPDIPGAGCEGLAGLRQSFGPAGTSRYTSLRVTGGNEDFVIIM